MPDTPNQMFIRILVVYTLHILGAGYIPYSVPSLRDNYGTLIFSEEFNVYSNDPALHWTLLGGVYSLVKPVIAPMPTCTI